MTRLRKCGLTEDLQVIGRSGGVRPTLHAISALGPVHHATIPDRVQPKMFAIESARSFFRKTGRLETSSAPLSGTVADPLPRRPEFNSVYVLSSLDELSLPSADGPDGTYLPVPA